MAAAVGASDERRNDSMVEASSRAAFLDTFRARGAAIAEACTRCGDCFRACPMVEPAGLAAADASETAGAIVDLITGGGGGGGGRGQRKLLPALPARHHPAFHGAAGARFGPPQHQDGTVADALAR